MGVEVRYVSEPALRYCGNGCWRLERDWTVEISAGGDSEMITVPAGFKTDFATIPAAFWCFVGLPDDETHRNAALLHDYLYTVGGDTEERRGADWIYYKTIRRAGRTRFKAAAEYVALRLCGWRHFNYKKQRTQTEE